ncbi:unnamed protein product [Heligmosomoides polygyrus]|uniref:F-box domain-containing protein n=1 Tax=Heligmosomoides polygyrus TaxID=6339 RepID=A0A183FHQ3_HELPZ|nr:unnamed protein product [Heligmosomoides polygyrus]
MSENDAGRELTVLLSKHAEISETGKSLEKVLRKRGEVIEFLEALENQRHLRYNFSAYFEDTSEYNNIDSRELAAVIMKILRKLNWQDLIGCRLLNRETCELIRAMEFMMKRRRGDWKGFPDAIDRRQKLAEGSDSNRFPFHKLNPSDAILKSISSCLLHAGCRTRLLQLEQLSLDALTPPVFLKFFRCVAPVGIYFGTFDGYIQDTLGRVCRSSSSPGKCSVCRTTSICPIGSYTSLWMRTTSLSSPPQISHLLTEPYHPRGTAFFRQGCGQRKKKGGGRHNWMNEPL